MPNTVHKGKVLVIDDVVRLRRLRAEDVDAVTVEEIQEAITRAQAAKARIQP